MTAVVADRAVPRGGLDIVYVLSLMQVAFLVLAALGEVVLMGGNPAYLLLPVIKSVLLIVFATHALRLRRWALRALVVLAWITLSGFVLQILIGFVPVVDVTVNLVGLMTNVALPAAVIWLCRPHLRAIKQARRWAKMALPVPQDPYVTVPLGHTAGYPVGYGAPSTPVTAPGTPPGYPPPGYPPTLYPPIVYPPVVPGRPVEGQR